jgi:FdhD protein
MTAEIPAPIATLRRRAIRGGGGASVGERIVPEETAIALTYNQASYAVMMATPADLEDFGVGFSLTEGVVSSPAEILDLETVANDLGVEIRMTLSGAAAARTADRRRRLAGPVGCGLCGVESLKEAVRPLPRVSGNLTVAPEDAFAAIEALSAAQSLNRATSAVHAAALWRSGTGLIAIREDVGRHNALDKLAGGLARAGIDAASGLVVISSRVSVEMVQKTAMMGAPILIAVSAPTALAVRTAEAASVTLVAIARADGFEVFSGEARVNTEV